MLNRRAGAALVAAILLPLGALVLAAEGTTERFTFTAAHAAAAGALGANRTELVVTRWSTDAERARVLDAAAAGAEPLGRAIAEGWGAGHVLLPGNLQYTLRYAHRVSRPDGGEDIVVATDRPIWWWWDAARPADAMTQNFTVIQLRLNKDGAGEGKLSASVSTVGGSKEAGTIVLQDYPSQPTLLNNVRRHRG